MSKKEFVIKILKKFNRNIILSIGTAVILCSLTYLSFLTNNDFIKNLTIASIPIGIGVLTSKWITDSWQFRSERSSIKREILRDFQNSSKKSVVLFEEFTIRVFGHYSSYENLKNLPNSGKIEYGEVNFPSDPNELPHKLFWNDFEILGKELIEIRFNASSFLSGVRLYYERKELENEFQTIQRNLRYVFFVIRECVNANTKENFIKMGSHYLDKIAEIKAMILELEETLVKTPLSKKAI